MSFCHDVCLSTSLSLYLLLRTLTYQFRLRLSSSCSQLTPVMEASRAAGHWAGQLTLFGAQHKSGKLVWRSARRYQGRINGIPGARTHTHIEQK